MLFCDFQHKIKKCNKRLWVDTCREVTPYYKEFPMAGLYIDDKYLCACSHQNVPEYSIVGINLQREERVLAKGWKTILCFLIRKNLITQKDAEKEFQCCLEPNRSIWPIKYIEMDF